MFVKDKDALTEQNNKELVLQGLLVPNKKAIKLWRKQGPPRKCYDFSVAVIALPQLLQKWLKLAKKRLLRDNSTR